MISGDADLKALMEYLEGVMKKHTKHNAEYVMDLDLSSNSYVTDAGASLSFFSVS